VNLDKSNPFAPSAIGAEKRCVAWRPDSSDKLTQPLHWRKPRRVFVNSMSDLFHESFSFEYIAQCFAVMAKAYWHTYQVLTKRTERAIEFMKYAAGGNHVWSRSQMLSFPTWEISLALHGGRDIRWPLPNVWFGTSISTQADADANLPLLFQIPAAIRYVSAEPLIELVDFDRYGWLDPRSTCIACEIAYASGAGDDHGRKHTHDGIDWLIVGGESGPGARPCNVEWIRSIIAQCKAADVPVFVKQLGRQPIIDVRDDRTISGWRKRALADRKGGDIEEWPEDLRVRQFPEGSR